MSGRDVAGVVRTGPASMLLDQVKPSLVCCRVAAEAIGGAVNHVSRCRIGGLYNDSARYR